MQRKLEMLEAKEHDNVAVVSPADASQASPSLQRSHYVGDGSGSDMFHRVSASANTAEARAKVLEQLNKHSLRKPPPIPSHVLPSFELANKLVDC
ncbi:hypothetical protein LTS08_004014 [Lithohypha guttulata]|nr:hypothetical protein LTS08_004014 [Lithohypha guttulata]